MKNISNKWFLFLIIAVSCTSHKQIDKTPRVRQLERTDAVSFHNPVEIRVGWFNYDERKIKSVQDGVWVIEKDSSMQQSLMPVILVNYDDSSRTVWLNPDIDDALLGKLIKHSLMTQKPIERPFEKYFEEANCLTCHPSNIRIRE